NVIRIAAGMSFLGLGAQPPTPEWGVMVSTGRSFLVNQWWVPTFPGFAILLAVFGFNLLGDGIRDISDPHLRRGE
ncbi:MAG: D,D-dipeptide ABC transporter permease, partial [Candidatus Heimdallarchaeota archaeon]